MAGLMTPSLGSFAPVGETEERTQRLARAAEQRRLAETTRQFDVSQELARDTFNENVRQFGLGYALDQQRLAENTRQFDLGFGLDERRLAENIRQFDVSQKLARDTFDENVRRFGLEYALRKAAEDRTAKTYEALQGMALGATVTPNVPLAPQAKRPTLVDAMGSGGAPTVTVPLTEGPSTTTAIAGLSVPGVDLSPATTAYRGVKTRDLINQYKYQRARANAGGDDASKAADTAKAVLYELQSRGVSEDIVDDFLEMRSLIDQRTGQGNLFRGQDKLNELINKLRGVDFNAVGPSESVVLEGGLDLGAFTATGRTADTLMLSSTPTTPLPTGEIRFDVSNRRQRLDATRQSLESLFELAKLRGDYAAVTELRSQYVDLSREETLVTGIESLQAASMGNIAPLRQSLANQNRTGDVQIYQNPNGTLDIVVKGQRYAGVTLGAIRQQLLADLDPATQQASAAAIKYQQELFLKLAPEMLKQQQEEGKIEKGSGRYIEPVKGEPFLIYIRGNTYYKVPVVVTTVGGVETRQFGEEQPVGTVR